MMLDRKAICCVSRCLNHLATIVLDIILQSLLAATWDNDHIDDKFLSDELMSPKFSQLWHLWSGRLPVLIWSVDDVTDSVFLTAVRYTLQADWLCVGGHEGTAELFVTFHECLHRHAWEVWWHSSRRGQLTFFSVSFLAWHLCLFYVSLCVCCNWSYIWH